MAAYSRESNGSPKSIEARKLWDAANLWRISLALPKAKKPEIQAAAEAAGLSINAWISQAVEEKLAAGK